MHVRRFHGERASACTHTPARWLSLLGYKPAGPVTVPNTRGETSTRDRGATRGWTTRDAAPLLLASPHTAFHRLPCFCKESHSKRKVEVQRTHRPGAQPFSIRYHVLYVTIRATLSQDRSCAPESPQTGRKAVLYDVTPAPHDSCNVRAAMTSLGDRNIILDHRPRCRLSLSERLWCASPFSVPSMEVGRLCFVLALVRENEESPTGPFCPVSLSKNL